MTYAEAKERLASALDLIGAIKRRRQLSTQTSASPQECNSELSEQKPLVVMSSTELSTQAQMLRERYGITKATEDDE